MGRTAERQKGSRPLFEEIEGRVLYSADGIGGLDVGLAEGDDAVLEASLLPTGTAEAHATPDQTARPAIHDAAHRREVAFIDANVPDYQRLIDDLSGADPSGRTIEVVLLDAETDGIARITHALADLGDLDAVHIISHGEDGAIQIGATRLDLMTLETRAEEVRSWGAALGENADLLVYGCDLAGSDAGRAMVDAFGALTGADMAASDDLTGAATLGRDWNLEYRTRAIEAVVAFTAEAQHDWSGALHANVDQASSQAGSSARADSNSEQTQAPTNEERVARHEVVFIDANVPDYQTLVAALSDDADPARSVEVVVLDPARNGIELVSATLQGRENLDAIHIISHADDGNVRLGSSALDAETLEQNKLTIALWADAFGESGDILIYGCNLAATESGKGLIDTLGELTRTDVAASDDLTGNLALGGDWALEYHAGSVETAVALDEDAQQSWSGVLATYTVSNTADAGAGSLRQAVTDANSSVGSDTIVFNIPGAGPHTINLAAALPTITGTVTLDGWSEPDHVDVPVVRIDGAAAGGGVTGLTLSGTADSSVIRGLMITGFSVNGVLNSLTCIGDTCRVYWVNRSWERKLSRAVLSPGIHGLDDGVSSGAYRTCA